MADLINFTDVQELLLRAFPPELITGLGFLINVGKVIGVLVIIYLAFLIVQAVVRIRQAIRIRSLSESVSEMNKKLDIIIKRLDRGKEEVKEKKDERKK